MDGGTDNSSELAIPEAASPVLDSAGAWQSHWGASLTTVPVACVSSLTSPAIVRALSLASGRCLKELVWLTFHRSPSTTGTVDVTLLLMHQCVGRHGARVPTQSLRRTVLTTFHVFCPKPDRRVPTSGPCS